MVTDPAACGPAPRRLRFRPLRLGRRRARPHGAGAVPAAVPAGGGGGGWARLLGRLVPVGRQVRPIRPLLQGACAESSAFPLNRAGQKRRRKRALRACAHCDSIGSRNRMERNGTWSQSVPWAGWRRAGGAGPRLGQVLGSPNRLVLGPSPPDRPFLCILQRAKSACGFPPRGSDRLASILSHRVAAGAASSCIQRRSGARGFPLRHPGANPRLLPPHSASPLAQTNRQGRI